MSESEVPGSRGPGVSRRIFIGAATAVTGAAVTGATTPAAAQAATTRRHSDLRDVKRVMIVMQENRSFDHYFGALKGVRGFGDRSTITLPGGLSVFQQPTSTPGAPITGTQYPWRLSDAPPSAYPAGHQPPTSELGAQGYPGTPHGWDDQHAAWNGGLMNGWVYAKRGLTTLGYLDRKDIPFHYALADAYTVADAYHCSVLSATGPNRTYLWSGTIDAQRRYSDFVAYSGGDELGRNLLWETYAETLQKAGISWKVYQGSDNYGDNGLEYFASFAAYDPQQGGTPAPGNVLYDNGVAAVPEPSTADNANADNLIAAIRADVQSGSLPQVTWVVSNQTFSEHSSGAPNDGAYLVDGILRALGDNPDVLDSTLVIISYDENDGQFDHVPPPVPPAGTKDEFYLETSGGLASAGVTRPMPVGLGFRVPLILVSPWTRGGWVTSEVSDHTSVIQFLEKWSAALGRPAICPGISDWRRRVCGDLTGAFDFESPVFGLPALPATGPVIGDPPGGAYHPPATTNAMPGQEPGTRPARALPHQPNANLDGFAFGGNGSVQALLSFTNAGPHARRAAHFSVYDNAAPPATIVDDPSRLPGQYTVDPSRTPNSPAVPGSVEIGAGRGDGRYDLTVVGPNRFLRHFAGDVTAPGRTAGVRASYDGAESGRPQLVLELANNGTAPMTFTVGPNAYGSGSNAYGSGRAGEERTYRVPAHGRARHVVNARESSHGWYDLAVTLGGDPTWSRRYVGHLEDGEDSVTG
jgi:phospholipase C